MTNTNISKLFGIFAILAIISMGIVTQVNAQTPNTTVESPYSKAVGTMETTTNVVDGFLYVKYTYTSDDIHRKYGFQTITKDEIVPIDESYTGPQNDSKVEANVEIEMIHENESNKLEQFQREHGNSPIFIHEKWKAVIPTTDSTAKNPILFNADYDGQSVITLLTHVPNWSGKDQSVYLKYDPIDVIWTDNTSSSSPLIDSVKSTMISNGWSSSTCTGGSSTLYINIAGRGWVGQDADRYKSTGGICDQYHVRMWYLNADQVVGAAHQEDTHGIEIMKINHIGGANVWEQPVVPFHVVHSFENGETQVKNAFTTCWSSSSNSHWMNNYYTREYYNYALGLFHVSANNNGYATQINKTC